MERNFTGMFHWGTSSEFVILVPIQRTYQYFSKYKELTGVSALESQLWI
jgi:hypothetical protein